MMKLANTRSAKPIDGVDADHAKMTLIVIIALCVHLIVAIALASATGKNVLLTSIIGGVLLAIPASLYFAAPPALAVLPPVLVFSGSVV